MTIESCVRFCDAQSAIYAGTEFAQVRSYLLFGRDVDVAHYKARNVTAAMPSLTAAPIPRWLTAIPPALAMPWRRLCFSYSGPLCTDKRPVVALADD